MDLSYVVLYQKESVQRRCVGYFAPMHYELCVIGKPSGVNPCGLKTQCFDETPTLVIDGTSRYASTINATTIEERITKTNSRCETLREENGNHLLYVMVILAPENGILKDPFAATMSTSFACMGENGDVSLRRRIQNVSGFLLVGLVSLSRRVHLSRA